MPHDCLYRHNHGYQCDLAATDRGWALIVSGLEPVDERFNRNLDDMEWEAFKALMQEGRTWQSWAEAFAAAPQTLWLVEGGRGEAKTVHTCTAEQFSGLAVAGGDEPAYVWTERSEGRWRTRISRNGEVQTVAESPRVLLGPSAVRDGSGRLHYAWAGRFGGPDTLFVQAEGDPEPFRMEGRLPSLAGLNRGVAVAFERFADGQSHVYYTTCDGGRTPDPVVRLSGHQPLNLQPIAAMHDGQVFVTWASSPDWGLGVWVDRQRFIELKQVDPATGTVEDGPGTEAGALPIPTVAGIRLKSNTFQNITPSNPRLASHNGQLICVYRVFDPQSDVLPALREVGTPVNQAWATGLVRFSDGQWSVPALASPSHGRPETAYGVISCGDELVIAEPAFEHIGTFPPRKHRVELHAVGDDLPRLHEGAEIKEAGPLDLTNPVTFAPALVQPPEGLQLVFGDMHIHSNLSNCYAMNDGSPTDNLRWRGDLLNDEVLTFTEHIRISDADYRYHLDLLEQLEGPCHVPIYGVEWAKPYIHNINFYTYDKQIMKRLRVILLAGLDYEWVCRQILEELPARTVAIMRHAHSDGRNLGGIHESTMGFCPELEWSMEVVSGRCDDLADEEWMLGWPKRLYFPTNFIRRCGARVGFYGGTDHFGAAASSTGFWVHDRTGPGVFDALRRRRTIACSRGKMALWMTANRLPMGAVASTARPVEIQVSVSSPLPLYRLSLWRDDGYIEHRDVEGATLEATFTDIGVGAGDHFYFVRAQSHQPDTHPAGPIVAYTSPIYLTIN
jgi:hypothetical protein